MIELIEDVACGAKAGSTYFGESDSDRELISGQQVFGLKRVVAHFDFEFAVAIAAHHCHGRNSISTQPNREAKGES
jgi:hypothetical protein